MAGDEKEKAAPASATEPQRVKKLESIVKRQRDVVREQQASITALMEHVDELQAKIASKDAEIIALQARGDVQQDQKAAADTASHGDGGTEDATKRLQQELQRQEQTVQKVQDQLAAAHERERALQLHIAQLQRASMAERAAASVSSPQSSALLPGSDTPSSQAPRETPHPSDIFRSPGVASTVSSPPGTGASSKSREEQLGKVRDNLLAAEKAIEKLRQQAAKAISASPTWNSQYSKRMSPTSTPTARNKQAAREPELQGGRTAGEEGAVQVGNAEKTNREAHVGDGRYSPCLSEEPGVQV